MITALEVQFVRDLVYDLAALADPSDYVEREVKEAYLILDKLASYDTSLILSIYQQLKEESKDHHDE